MMWLLMPNVDHLNVAVFCIDCTAGECHEYLCATDSDWTRMLHVRHIISVSGGRIAHGDSFLCTD